MADLEPLDPDICRVCRSEGTPMHPLFHPCICSGSIKWVHQDCLMQWLHYSERDHCEICSYRYVFIPIYSPDMPDRIPFTELAAPVLTAIVTAIKHWLFYILVAFAWCVVVPVTARRIYRALLAGPIAAILTLPFDLFKLENLVSDIFQGYLMVVCTLYTLRRVVWLRRQMLRAGNLDWPQADAPAPVPNNDILEEDENEEENIQELEEIIQEMEAEDNNWLRMEWEHAAEELDRAEFLGHDISLIFLQVFLITSLITLFVLIFVFFPYHMGVLTLSLVNMRPTDIGSYFEGFLTGVMGYCTIVLVGISVRQLAKVLGYYGVKRVLWLCCEIVKVSVLSLVGFGIFPLVCGCWLDFCSLEMFGATLKDRESSFSAAPGICIFIHWLIGVIYIHYFASFVLLLRRILRPGVLWFLCDFNNANFNPLQELSFQSLFKHIWRLFIAAVILGSVAVLMLWLPIIFLKIHLPSYLPYTVSLNSEILINELTLQLLFLMVILPTLFQYIQMRIWLKGFVKLWCRAVGWILNIHSYLLGNGDEQPNGRRLFFVVQLVGLFVSVCFSLVACSLTVLTVPVWVGRHAMAFSLVRTSLSVPQIFASTNTVQTEVKVHEFFTASFGLFLCWLSVRVITLVLNLLRQGRVAIVSALKQWFILGLKTLMASTIFLGVIPLMFGMCVKLMIIIPLRVPIEETPIMFIYQDWALGVVYTLIVYNMTLRGADWFLRDAIERAHWDGIRDMDLSFLFRQLAAPVIVILGSVIAIPYVLAHLIVPLFLSNVQMTHLIARLLYPFMLLLCVIVLLVVLQISLCKKWIEHIRNSNYSMGRLLVNYNHM